MRSTTRGTAGSVSRWIRGGLAVVLPAALSLTVAGCAWIYAGNQSALDPRGSSARDIAESWWVMFWGGLAILALVMVLALYALLRRSGPGLLGRPWLILAGGVALPVVALSGLLIYGFDIGRDFAATAGEPDLTVEVVGKRWWWEVRYLDGPDAQPVVAANEIHVPAGAMVEFAVSTADVIHSFWVPNLAGKIDMIPGTVNRVRIAADRPGVYRGQCAEYCGAQHALMAFFVVVHPPEEFSAWLDNERRSARAPDTAFLEQGREAFLEGGCGACHTVRGTPAAGTFGPDLTHVGGRRSLAAGTLDNHVGTLAGWIADSQTIKPGNLMPSFPAFEGETLRAIAAYLESLE